MPIKEKVFFEAVCECGEEFSEVVGHIFGHRQEVLDLMEDGDVLWEHEGHAFELKPVKMYRAFCEQCGKGSVSYDPGITYEWEDEWDS